MKRITKQADLQSFQEHYESQSGLDVPMHYLEISTVYALYCNGEMCGGFVLGQNKELRTIEVFASSEYRNKLNELQSQQHFCEICCFWMDRSLQKRKAQCLAVWLQMAWKVSLMKNPFVIFGTNCFGLAKLYGLPEHSLLCHQDMIDNKQTYIFIGHRRMFLGGVLEIVLSRLLRKRKTKTIESDPNLLNELYTDIAIQNLQLPNPQFALTF